MSEAEDKILIHEYQRHQTGEERLAACEARLAALEDELTVLHAELVAHMDEIIELEEEEADHAAPDTASEEGTGESGVVVVDAGGSAE